MANNQITSSKLSSSFVKFVSLLDNSAGHSVGWNPNGGVSESKISNSAVKANSIISTTVNVIPEYGIDVAGFYVTVNPNTNRVYIADFGPHVVKVLDGQSQQIIEKIDVGGQVAQLATDTKNDRIFAATGSKIVVIDGFSNSVIGSIS